MSVVTGAVWTDFFIVGNGDEEQRKTRLPMSSTDAAMVSGLRLRRMERIVSAASLDEG